MRKLLTAIALTATLSAPVMANNTVEKINLCSNMADAYSSIVRVREAGLPKSFVLDMIDDTDNPAVIEPMRQAADNIYNGIHDGLSVDDVRALAFDKCIEVQFK